MGLEVLRLNRLHGLGVEAAERVRAGGKSQSTRLVAAVARIFLRISSFAQPQPWQGTKDEVVGAAALGTIALLSWLRINCSPSDVIDRDFAR